MKFLILLFILNPEKIEIHGAKGIFYEYRNFSGSYPEGFYPYSLRQEYLKMKIKGILRYSTEINGEVFQNSNPLRKDHVFLNLKNPYFILNLGDHQIFLEENSLLLSKTYNQGASGNIFYKDFQGGFIYTKTKGKNLYKRFRGNNTQGPFYLEPAPLVQESERVRIIRNGKYEEVKRGIDYEIDYFSGTITFLNRIIKEDEIVEVFYQAKEENLNEIYGFMISAKYLGYSEVNLRNRNLKEGVYGFDLNIPLRYLNLRFESAFDKYNSKNIGAYGGRGIFNYRNLKMRGYYKKFNDFYKPIESLYFQKGGREDSVSGECRWFYFKRYDFDDISRKEKNYLFGLRFDKFGYEFSESYLKEGEKYISSLNSFYLRHNIREIKFGFDYAFGKERNPALFSGNRNVYIVKGNIGYRKSFFDIRLNSNYKIAGIYKEYGQKGDFNLSFKKANIYLRSEYFKNSKNPQVFILNTGYRFYPYKIFKMKGFLKREYKFLSDSLGNGNITSLSNTFDLLFKRNSFSPFINFREIKGERYYFNYISKGFNLILSPLKDLRIVYLSSSGSSKNSKDKKSNLSFSKNINKFLFVYEYLYLLNKGKSYFDTISSNSQRVKANKFMLNFLNTGKSVQTFLRFSDSLWIREEQRVDYNTITLSSKFSKDIRASLSFYTGISFNKKKGMDTHISSQNILDFYTISPFTGIIGRYKNYLTVEASFEIENSLKRNINYGSQIAGLNLSFNYKKINISAGLENKKFLSPPYQDLRFTFNGEIKF